MIYYLFYNIFSKATNDPDPAGSVINWFSGSVIRDYGSAGPGSERNIYGSGTPRVMFTLRERKV